MLSTPNPVGRCTQKQLDPMRLFLKTMTSCLKLHCTNNWYTKKHACYYSKWKLAKRRSQIWNEAAADLRLLLASASARGAAACSSFYAPQQQQKALKKFTKSAIDVAKDCDRLPWRSRSIWPKIMIANRWKFSSFSSCEVWSGVEQQGFRVLGFVAGQPRQINIIPIVILPKVACMAGPSVNSLPS